MPPKIIVPAFIPSGLSVSVLKTITGLPSIGASSCIPPESVNIKYALFNSGFVRYYSRLGFKRSTFKLVEYSFRKKRFNNWSISFTSFFTNNKCKCI